MKVRSLLFIIFISLCGLTITTNNTGGIIVVKSKPTDNEIGYDDIFDNHFFLTNGEIHLSGQTVVRDQHWKHQTQFILPEQFDPISFEINKTDGFWYLRVPEEKLERELNFDVYFRKSIAPIRSPKEAFRFDTTPQMLQKPTSRDKQIAEYYDQKNAFLRKYCNDFGLSASFEATWQTIIAYEKMATVLGVQHELNRWNTDYLRQITERYTDQLNNDSLLHLPDYRRSAQLMAGILVFLKVKAPTLSNWYEVIGTHFQGITRDYLGCMLLVNTRNGTSKVKYSEEEWAICEADFLKSASDERYKEYLTKSRLKEEYLSDSRHGTLLNLDKKTIDFYQLHEGNGIVYIDFWASWCAPCRAEMPASKKLSTYYSTKGVQFVYISTDTNPAAWEKASRQIGLPDSTSYIIPNAKSSALVQKFKISTIPRYMIIGKDGKVINADAPRPSDPKLRVMFDELLKK
jgi:thiol-disulfide isomerase/thioredoxin